MRGSLRTGVSCCLLSILFGAGRDGSATDASVDSLTNVATRVEVMQRVSAALAAGEGGAAWPTDLPTITQLAAHEARRVRWHVTDAVYDRACALETGSTARRGYVEFMADRLADPEPLVSQAARKWLLSFEPRDFASNAVQKIKARFDAEKSNETILLMGLADIDYCLEKIADILKENKEVPGAETLQPAYNSIGWSALLVAARKGDKDSIRRVLEIAEQGADIHIRLAFVFKDLEYVRQPQVVDYLRKYLFSDEVFQPKADDVFPFRYAWQAAHSLGRMLKGFPFDEKRGFAPDTIQKCRKWMSEQKTWEFK